MEETDVRPKPMVEIGGRPILWHIMMHYSHHGFNEFVIALGYKGEQIKKYMLDYGLLQSSLTIRTASGDVLRHNNSFPDWTVHLVDTGMATLTGGRPRTDTVRPATIITHRSHCRPRARSSAKKKAV